MTSLFLLDLHLAIQTRHRYALPNLVARLRSQNLMRLCSGKSCVERDKQPQDQGEVIQHGARMYIEKRGKGVARSGGLLEDRSRVQEQRECRQRSWQAKGEQERVDACTLLKLDQNVRSSARLTKKTYRMHQANGPQTFVEAKRK